MGIPVASPPSTNSETKPTLVRGLTLLDSVLLLASGIIGSSIFLTAKDIAGPLPQPILFLGVWVLGGIISLFGCVAFAELGSMFPDSGGQYIYLREAYGDLPAFLYGWMLFSVANGGSIAALAVASAAYMGQVVPVISQEHVVVSALGVTLTRAHIVGLFLIAILTYVNVVGLRWGALMQNLSTWTKFAAMAAFVVLGFAIGKGHWANFSSHGASLTMGLSPGQFISAMGIGLIAVFWAYDGWVYITWVAGEVKEPRRNVPLAMVLGILVVGVIYMAMNLTYVYAMPLSEIAKHETIAHAAATALFSPACRSLALCHHRYLLLQRRRYLHSVGRARLSCHGAGRRFLQTHGGNPSQVAHPRLQPDRTRSLGRHPNAKRTLRSALHLRDLWHGAVLHADRDCAFHPALEAARHSASLPLRRISMAARNLRASRHGLDAEHHHHPPHRSLLGDSNCVDRRPRIFVLEAKAARSRRQWDRRILAGHSAFCAKNLPWTPAHDEGNIAEGRADPSLAAPGHPL